MINIVIPMAGAGSRFSLAGYKEPKPFIDVLGKPMIQWVIENLTTKFTHRFILICQREHLNESDFATSLGRICENFEVIPIDGLTQGAAETVLFAAELIDNDDSLIIANSDQYIEYKFEKFIHSLIQKKSDGCILTMASDSPKWSYLKFNDEFCVTEVREKEVISEEATVGIYGFAKGADFVRGAKKMISDNSRVNGEFYVAPVYNELIKEGRKIFFENIGSENNQMNGLGTPEDLSFFIRKMQT